jgi:hypothetical protein
MNVLLLVPDGVSARNFLLTGLPHGLTTAGKVDVLVNASFSSSTRATLRVSNA